MTKRSGRGGRRPRPPHLRIHPGVALPPREHAESGQDQPLLQALRIGLRADHPLDFLAVVSGFLEVTDPRNRDPFSRGEKTTSRDELIDSFTGTSFAETTAALTAIRAMTTDELMAARIGRELATRRQPMPEWLVAMDRALIEPQVWFMTHVLGDGDDYVLGVTLPSGERLSAVVYVDHNMGTVVKDAFIVPAALSEVTDRMVEVIDDPDQTLTLVDAALARAVIEEAIDHGSRLYPPLESDSWPMCRPLVEWMVRMLPGGGQVPARPEHGDAEVQAIADAFFVSTFGAGLDGPDQRDLLDSILWFGTDYGPGDPLRWSPVNVEMLLADWFPRKIVAEPAFLSLLPELLRAFIRYCHHERGIRPELTAETLAAVDEWEPEYQRLIRSGRLQGPQALLAGFPHLGMDEEGLDFEKIMLESLDRRVGSRLQLMALDDDPLPDEAFEWAGVPEDIRPVVHEWLDACDRVADEVLDAEHRTAMRRFLSRAAVGAPATFRRRSSAQRGAAAVAWVICRANETVGAYWSGLSVQDLLAHFGVTGSVSQRAEPLLRANGVDPHARYGSMDLGAPDLLTSKARAEILQQRDECLTSLEG